MPSSGRACPPLGGHVLLGEGVPSAGRACPPRGGHALRWEGMPSATGMPRAQKGHRAPHAEPHRAPAAEQSPTERPRTDVVQVSIGGAASRPFGLRFGDHGRGPWRAHGQGGLRARCTPEVPAAHYGGTGIKLDPLPGASSVPGWFGGCAWRSLRSECVRACAEGCDGCAGTLHRARGRDSEVEPELYSGFLENHEKS